MQKEDFWHLCIEVDVSEQQHNRRRENNKLVLCWFFTLLFLTINVVIPKVGELQWMKSVTLFESASSLTPFKRLKFTPKLSGSLKALKKILPLTCTTPIIVVVTLWLILNYILLAIFYTSDASDAFHTAHDGGFVIRGWSTSGPPTRSHCSHHRETTSQNPAGTWRRSAAQFLASL